MKLRLLKVICQPVFVIDDGESLTEQTAEPVVVSAADWPTYATTAFAAGFEALRQQVEGVQAPAGGASSEPCYAVLDAERPKVQCPECGARQSEWCDITCLSHACGTCGLPHPTAPDGSRPWVDSEAQASLARRLAELKSGST